MKFVVLLGRILFSLTFILESFGGSPKETIAWAAQNGVPMASILIPLAWIVAFLGGLSILLGYKAKIGAWLIALYSLCIAFVITKMSMRDPAVPAFVPMLILVRHLSTFGAALIIAYFGSGPFSLDHRKHRAL